MIEDFINKDKKQLLDEKLKRIQNCPPDVAGLINGQYDPIILAKCVEDLEKSADTIAYSVDNFRKSIEDIGKKSDKLSGKLLWLNIVLTVATVIGAIATAILAFKK